MTLIDTEIKTAMLAIVVVASFKMLAQQKRPT
jgi:hypothetical protein